MTTATTTTLISNADVLRVFSCLSAHLLNLSNLIVFFLPHQTQPETWPHLRAELMRAAGKWTSCMDLSLVPIHGILTTRMGSPADIWPTDEAHGGRNWPRFGRIFKCFVVVVVVICSFK